jgi:aryl-alcohol dehydrogenase-like predicted oxidoreductase
VQNRYNPGDRNSEAVLEVCERDGIALLPWAPIITAGTPAQVALDRIATAHGASAQQVSLAWLLQRSAVMIPIPGTSKIEHLDANIEAAWLSLSDGERSSLDTGA